ncbi:hypothetical protein RF11_14751 [Thelohanellus kitauei]|uniref:Uncharacterized protein n=1 Tax=Thelohanellus kitauei TaxID=669202 RepID=A0A0C2ILC0_THEKT|nr:hypothetical protein RF11_14751 [Thelohanellus kitauei]
MPALDTEIHPFCLQRCVICMWSHRMLFVRRNHSSPDDVSMHLTDADFTDLQKFGKRYDEIKFAFPADANIQAIQRSNKNEHKNTISNQKYPKIYNFILIDSR